MSKFKRSLSLLFTVLAVIGLIIVSSGVKQSVLLNFFSPEPALAQSVRLGDIWQQVYQQLPDLPLENQYFNKETRQVDANNTLVNRLIRYHIYVKSRPPNYRLDWKLTLADYLGANELMDEEVYPGYDALQQNPFAGDRAAIKRLNRQQRDDLVQTLATLFSSSNPTPNSQ